jgi:hypothetical protein
MAPHGLYKPASIIDTHTTHHLDYAVSQQKLKRIEQIYGWLKTISTLRKTHHPGVVKVDWTFTLALAAYNPVRMRNLLPASV